MAGGSPKALLKNILSPAKPIYTARAIEMSKPDIKRFSEDLAIDKKLQSELKESEPEAWAYTLVAKQNGYDVSIEDVENIFKDLVWLARVGDDIDHA